ncbi:hypothetical protein DPMN_193936 [Dreissena polymorpha]|uniref:Uncharacterized protein n=1 Tax=Dreissena polymorpha TaxID=45954 RepID=A0A9D3Y590_DREPO|nr:hypothetical protein DPMN_193936 [Dreissena polymorpha]
MGTEATWIQASDKQRPTYAFILFNSCRVLEASQQSLGLGENNIDVVEPNT